MNIYAIHREGVWTTDYNVWVCSSRKIAEHKISKLNELHQEWLKYKAALSNGDVSDYFSTQYMDFIYNNPQPPKYRIEKIEVLKK